MYHGTMGEHNTPQMNQQLWDDILAIERRYESREHETGGMPALPAESRDAAIDWKVVIAWGIGLALGAAWWGFVVYAGARGVRLFQ